jgi:O-antigen/teichoic acid export membrane protein
MGFFTLIALSLSMAIGLALISSSVIIFLFGTNYSSAIPLLQMLGWSLIPYTISSFISYDLIAREQENTLVKATAISLSLFLVLNIWLVSAYHLTGAVYAALAGETLQAIVFILFRISLLLKSHIESASSQRPETT